MKFYLKSLIVVLVISVVSLAVSIGLTTHASAADCDDNAVVRCGTYSLDSLRSSYTGDVKAIFNYFGITDAMIAGNGVEIKEGYVTKSGDVVLGGETIATGALTAGRQDIAGSTKVTSGGATFYTRAPSVSFVSDSIEAYIFVDQDGTFKGAVIKSCGNPVKATPKVVQPKTTPSAACERITINKISRTEYSFTANASAKDGATVSGYVFTITGPLSYKKVINQTSNELSATSDQVTIDQAGTYKVSVVVKTSVGDKTNADCSASFTVTAPENTEVCDPATGKIIEVAKSEADKYKPVNDAACQPKVLPTKSEPPLPSTGPEQALSGVAGLGALTAAGHYYRASRNRLNAMLRK